MTDRSNNPAAGDRPEIPADSLERQHERRDVGISVMVGFGLAMTLFAILGATVSWWTMDLLIRQRSRADRPASPLAEERPVPPEPRLEVAPGRQLERLRAEEEPLLSEYAWVSREAGVVRIPIERAMELVAERGLPATAANAGSAASDRGPAATDGETGAEDRETGADEREPAADEREPAATEEEERR